MNQKNVQIAITGGTGLVGSHVMLKYCQEGMRIRALVRDPQAAEKKIREVFSLYDDQPERLISLIEFRASDLLDIFSLEEALSGINSVIHCAGIVSGSSKNRKAMWDANVTGTSNIVNIAQQQNLNWFCHISSVSAFGERNETEIEESLFWKYSPKLSDYAISKYGAEREVWRAMEEGLSAVIISPSVVLGPSRENPSLNRFYKYLQKELPFYTNGITGYVDARDLAEVIFQLYLKKKTGERYIVSAENRNFRDMLQMIAKAMNLKPPGKPAPAIILKFLSLFYPALIRSVTSQKHYLNKKIIQEIGISFRTVEESIENMVRRD